VETKLSDQSETSPKLSRSGQNTSLTLLEQIRARDESAWETVIELYRPLVLHWCCRWGVVREDGDDILQNVFRAAAHKLPTFRRDRPGDTFRGWLRGITRYELLQFFRRNGKQPKASGGTENLELFEQIADPFDATPDDSVDPPEELDGLYHRAVELTRLDFENSTWQAFERTALDGNSSTVVAEQLGMTSAAVRKAKSRVLRRLKELIGDLVD